MRIADLSQNEQTLLKRLLTAIQSESSGNAKQ
jgi:hypothetical protein